MADKRAGEFEQAINRLEAIVKLLETGDVGLDESVALFREGRALARKCEELLRVAQEEVDAATRDPGHVVQAGRKSAGSLFGDDQDREELSL
jgi:exodeoxyribonuclease VII small subunit